MIKEAAHVLDTGKVKAVGDALAVYMEKIVGADSSPIDYRQEYDALAVSFDKLFDAWKASNDFPATVQELYTYLEGELTALDDEIPREEAITILNDISTKLGGLSLILNAPKTGRSIALFENGTTGIIPSP